MQAFHNDISIKDNLLAQLQAHYDSDEIVKGVYWENGKGCAIGCAIHSDDHKLYEKLFDIPEWLARLQDRIFEGLPNERAKEFPLLFTKSINVGANLNSIKIPFLIFVLESVLNKFNHEKFPKVKKSINKVLSSLKNGNDLSNAAYAASGAAAYAAYGAADYAADAAGYAADAAAAESYDAAAAYADYAAAAAGYAADAAGYASDAKEKTYEIFAKKLIELISNAK